MTNYTHEDPAVEQEKPTASVYMGDLTVEDFNRFLAAKALGIDTETKGLNPRRDRLCLVQISDGDYTVVLRVPRIHGTAAALREDLGAMFPNLRDLLRSDIPKVFHFARFDIAFLKYWLGLKFIKNVFCTKIASKLVRTYTDKHSLQAVVEDVLGVRLEKGYATTSWDGPLSAAQIKYATEDVTSLPELYSKLKEKLEDEGRMHLALECNKFLNTLTDLDINEFSNIFEH